MLSKDGDKKEVEKASSSEESDKEEKPLTLQRVILNLISKKKSNSRSVRKESLWKSR